MHHSGFVALIGRPNVGKSTLLNALVGEKVAIISERPQTTRNRIRAVLTRPRDQLIFIDTPGLHKPRHELGSAMVKKALNTMREVDLVFFIVEGHLHPGRGDLYIAGLLNEIDSPVFLILNKTDLAGFETTGQNSRLYSELHRFHDSFSLSALEKKGLDPLIEAAAAILPEGPQYYPPEMVTDQPEIFIAAEIIREKIIPLTRQEIPFSVAVVVEEMKARDDSDLLDIRAEIFVERKSQVGIIVGKGGMLLKQIGTAARVEMEALFGRRIFLDLRVKVKKDWRNSLQDLRRFGYRD